MIEPVIIQDVKKSYINGLIWRKERGIWHLESVETNLSKYRLYGGIAFSGFNYMPYEGWVFSQADGITTKSQKFKEEVDALKFAESHIDKDFYI